MSEKSLAVMVKKCVAVGDVAKAIVTDETPRKSIPGITICLGRATIKKVRSCCKLKIEAVFTPHCRKAYIEEARLESKTSH